MIAGPVMQEVNTEVHTHSATEPHRHIVVWDGSLPSIKLNLKKLNTTAVNYFLYTES